MINSISIRNFETHLKTDIDLHPGVNILIGESDEGKSGIIRAIKWNIQNRPQGDSYRNDQLDPKKKTDKTKTTEVKINYKESGLVLRARDGVSGGINHYQIDKKEPLRALRSDVPDEVKDISKMKTVNIQGQHPTEQYFLLADKPGQVAKEFNKVAGLTVMDKALADINSQYRSCNTEIKKHKEEIKEHEEEIKDTKWVDKAEKLAEKLNTYQNKLKNKQAEYGELNHKIIHVAKINDTLTEKFNDLDSAIWGIAFLKREKQEIKNKITISNNLNKLLSSIVGVDSLLNEYVDINKALKSLKTLNLLNDKIQNHTKKYSNINLILSKLKQNEEDTTEAEIDLVETTKEYNIIREEQECPVCGRKGETI